jgi:hypothetical protein
MNKTQEIAALQTFIESLDGETYLRDALTESAPFFIAAMKCDIHFDFAGNLRQHAIALREDREVLANLRGEVKTAKDSLDALKRETISARRELSGAITELENAQNAIISAVMAARRVLKSSAA